MFKRPKRIHHAIFNIPVEAICEYLNIDDMVTLRRTHHFFYEKYCQRGRPVIHLSFHDYQQSVYSNLVRQFPKAKLVVPQYRNELLVHTFAAKYANFISIDLSYVNYIRNNISTFTNLTYLCLYRCNAITTELANLTQLEELNLSDNCRVLGLSLQKLTRLRKLHLDNNLMINDYDIVSLPIRSLSLRNNRVITPYILGELNLTQLHICKNSVLSKDMSKCTTLIDLELDAWADYIKEMTHLRKLTIYNIQASVTIPPLVLLETLIVKNRSRGIIDFGLCKNLLHLEVTDYFHRIELSGVTNLTYLYVGEQERQESFNLDVSLLKNLKKLIIDTDNYDRNLDIACLRSLISLEINRGVLNSLVANENLRSLAIKMYPRVDDVSLGALTNLKYLYLWRLGGISVSCFKKLHNLFLVEIDYYERDERILFLEKRDVIVRHLSVWNIYKN
ncbi:MAG: hypothetical protein Hyperionvirus1_198 [Hyperionvirus sp.]|uniref:Leucine-rich repeat protein n=1 Tax=Hyperionvirus sp. TaxID=2487770 RepID=A0A3G5ABD0_9VIRU|nr:MAG: hypothetical protein Hyperionvirus1_198 [Hyperionvirus sp.]